MNLKNSTNEPVYQTETDSQTERTSLWLPQGMLEGDKLGLRDCVTDRGNTFTLAKNLGD